GYALAREADAFDCARGAGTARRFDGLLAGGEPAVRGTRGDGVRALPQARDDPAREARFDRFVGGCVIAVFKRVHGAIPFALSAFANACTAREQCVFTLPSEQPIVTAVSATLSSSQ